MTTRYNASRLQADNHGGTCDNIIDLSNEHPAIAQVAPGLWRMDLPWKPLMIGHAEDYHGDQDGPVLTDGQMFLPGSELPVQVCTTCDVEVIVASGPEFTFLIADHRPGCGRYAELASRRTS